VKTVAIVQARLNSTRLPGKVLFDLAGEPMIVRLVQRLRRCRSLDDIIVAVPDGDAPLIQTLVKHKIYFLRGSENDVLERTYMAAVCHQAHVIVRVPGDNPLVEPAEVDRIIRARAPFRTGLWSNIQNVMDNNYPDGIGAEVFDMTMLRRARKNNPWPELREHVHLNFRVTGTVNCPKEFARPDIRLDVNTREDYEYIQKIYQTLGPDCHITEIIAKGLDQR
jgi:spore coat polysaccharide biosynthesis protein SpsF